MKRWCSVHAHGIGAGVLLGSLAVLLLVFTPFTASAQAVPEKLEVPAVGGTLAVLMTYPDGLEGEVFNRSNPLVFDINFTLALSATGTYPVTFTLIQEEGGKKTENEIWKGTLEEGYYRLRYPLDSLPSSSGDVNAKVVMKVRMYVKRYTDVSSYQYYNWEGAYRIGKIR